MLMNISLNLPDPPDTGFIGRSPPLLALERLLACERYAVIHGQGGEGKTALAVELARWMVRSNRVERAAFVSVEGLEPNPALAVLDVIGRQLLPADTYSVAEYSDLDHGGCWRAAMALRSMRDRRGVARQRRAMPSKTWSKRPRGTRGSCRCWRRTCAKRTSRKRARS